jgi:cytosine/adenosine deaminase-related metal-dependent hydrolase
MIASGITTYADFREGGTTGVQLELKALKETRQRAVILGRPNYHFKPNEVSTDVPLKADTVSELSKTIELCAGVGLSGPNEYTDTAMNQISNLTKSKGKLLATHAAESAEGMKFSIEHFSMTEAVRALRYLKPDFVVHFTNSTQEDLRYVSEANVPVVCCPRANSVLGLGFPPIRELIEAKVTVALGTDNVMLNAPDMFREMDYTSKMLRSTHRDPAIVSSKQVLEMATLNGARALGLESKIGSLKEGKRADIAFLNLNSPNLRFSNDLIASIVHRARSEDVECVMVDGEIVHGSIRSIANPQ